MTRRCFISEEMAQHLETYYDVQNNELKQCIKNSNVLKMHEYKYSLNDNQVV